ncbi:hypothetical protein FACS189449_07050 [Alphaproteobacteria bacterium]|nr:hypothetical protein FACS189449_07050 [Alphaproteobacteria bacterium]
MKKPFIEIVCNHYSNLEVFIATYNRADMLQEALCSICVQTAKGFKIKILDNCSTDHTKDVVEKIKKRYLQREIEFIGNDENTGPSGNFLRAQKLASAEYVMVFHDDDIMHPRYIEAAMEIILRQKDVSVVIGACKDFHDEQSKIFDCVPSNDVFLCGAQGLITTLLMRTFNFGSIIYRTDYFKNTISRNDIFGIVADKPFVIDAIKDGKAALFKDPYVLYRIHSEQDSNIGQTADFMEHLLSLVDYYREKLEPCNGKVNHIMCRLCVCAYVMILYRWGGLRRTISKSDFIALAVKRGAIRRFDAFVWRRIINKIGFLKKLYKNRLEKICH